VVIGIVLVSHSATLAQGLAEMLAAIGSADVPVAVAGGAEHGGLGTSVEFIQAAIDAADRGEGVVIIPDLGSSVLSARTVLGDADGHRAVLVDAPFVEGAVAAAVTAASGASLEDVAEAARQARDVPKF
jgi:phosphoenolpyruvate---glycerone phosphotransferase subunit DhaM